MFVYNETVCIRDLLGNLGKRKKMLIFKSHLTVFEVSNIFEATGALSKVGSAQALNLISKQS